MYVESMPIAPVPSTSARWSSQVWRPPIERACRIPRSQIDAGSTSTPSRPSERGMPISCAGSSGTSSRANPCRRVIPRSL